MFHKGINKKIIVETAKNLIEEVGINSFSMRLLAERLEIKAASIYAHIESLEKLFTEIGLTALNEQRDFLIEMVGEKVGDEAVFELAKGYRWFANEHKELYKLIMQMPCGNDDVLKKAAAITAEPFMEVLNGFGLDEKVKMHWQRVLRGIMHGFVSEEQFGYFSHYPVDICESYNIAVQCAVDGLHSLECCENE